jgi:hypothetical protein
MLTSDSARLFSRPTIRPSERGQTPGRTDDRIPELLAILRVASPNVLLIGDDADIARAFQRIQPYLRPPIAQWVPDITSTVPATTFSTLVVKDVRNLDGERQATLAALIDAVPDVQIVSMSRAPLLQLIDSGAFLFNLYYRLNIVTVDLTRKPVSAGRR